LSARRFFAGTAALPSREKPGGRTRNPVKKQCRQDGGFWQGGNLRIEVAAPARKPRPLSGRISFFYIYRRLFFRPVAAARGPRVRACLPGRIRRFQEIAAGAVTLPRERIRRATQLRLPVMVMGMGLSGTEPGAVAAADSGNEGESESRVQPLTANPRTSAAAILAAHTPSKNLFRFIQRLLTRRSV
jgi:hypothetical protein